MKYLEPVIPEGWTYLRHGTGFDRWHKEDLEKGFTVGKFNELNKNISFGLSCVERSVALNDAKRGYNTAKNYGNKNNFFEIRVLIYQDSIRYKSENQAFLENRVVQEIREELFKNYYNNRFYGGRHPVVPRNTELIYLGTSTYDEISNTEDHLIYWYVPLFLLNYYNEDVINEEKKRGLIQ